MISLGKKLGYAVSILTIISVLGGGLTALHSKIAWASDVRASFDEIEESISEARRQELADNIFEKNFLIKQGTATPLDKALKDRYELQLEDLNADGDN